MSRRIAQKSAKASGRPRRDEAKTLLAQRLHRIFPLSVPMNETAAVMGVPKSTAGNYWRGDSDTPAGVIERICRAMRVCAQWLVLGEGPMFPTPANRAAETAAGYRTVSPGVLAVVGAAAADDSAGRLVALEAPEGWHRLPRGCAAVDVVGRSLAPVALPGQKVLVDTRDRSARDGDLVVLETTEADIYAKRFYDEGEHVTLTSTNPVDRQDPVRIPWAKVRQVRVIVGVLFE